MKNAHHLRKAGLFFSKDHLSEVGHVLERKVGVGFAHRFTANSDNAAEDTFK